MTTARIKKLVAQNQLKQAITHLVEFCEKHTPYDEDAILLSSHFNNLERDRLIANSMTTFEARQERSRIAEGILFILNRIENDFADQRVILSEQINCSIFDLSTRCSAMTIDSLKDESLKLDRSARKELAYFLLDSLISAEGEEALTPKQQRELDRRLEAFENGEMELIPGDDFVAELKTRHGL